MNSIFTSKFVQTIKTLSEKELKSFDNWLRSPWCNSNKNLISLFEQIRKHYPHFDNPKVTKEKLFQKILPNGKYSDRRMNNLLSEAYLTAEKFIIFQNLKRDQNLQKDLLTQEFQNRHLEDWFFKNINSEIERLETKEVKDWEDHVELLKLHRRVYHHPNQNPRMQPGSSTIVKMGEQIDLVYLLEKAAIINEKISRNQILKDENHDIKIELKKWQIASKDIEHPSIEFYRIRFDYSEENILEKYFELREGFFKRFEELNEKQQKIHFISLLNDSIKLVRSRKFNITELLPLYKLGLKSEILIHEGILPYYNFAAIVAASNTKGDFEFSNEMIEVYSEKLDTKVKKDGVFWAKAHIEYYKGNLDNCLDYLLNHDFKIQYFLQITKMLTTQTYFDLYLTTDGYQSYLFNYFDSYEKWIQREKFGSPLTKKSYLRFVQVSRILAKSFSEADFKEEKIKNLLKSELNIQGGEWLGRKIEMIIEKRSRGRSIN